MADRELLMPDLGEDDIEGTVVGILVAPEDHVDFGQALLEVETDKVTMEVPAESAGRIRQLLVKIGDTTRAGEPFALIAETSPETAPTIETPPPGPSVESTLPRQPQPRSPGAAALPTPMTGGRPDIHPGRAVPAGPGARREARELGVLITDVPGTGAKGRISKKDVRVYVKHKIASEDAATAYAARNPDLPDLGAFGPLRREPLTRIQQTTAQNMTRSSTLIPHAWIEQLADITLLETRRRAIRLEQSASAPPLTLTALLCKTVAMTLQDFPRFNAAIDLAAQELVLREYTNVGIAVDTERGLVVPVIRDAAAKTIHDIAADLDKLSRLARDNKLPAGAFKGAGITITNLGGIGVSAIYPVINWPEVAIIGVASTRPTASFDEGRLENRSMLPLTLGFDHRVINGAEAARFLGKLKEALEHPFDLFASDPVEPVKVGRI